MKKSIILITILIAFVMNGCLVDRIKQRIHAKELQQQSMQKQTIQKKKVVTKTVEKSYVTNSPSAIEYPTPVIQTSTESVEYPQASRVVYQPTPSKLTSYPETKRKKVKKKVSSTKKKVKKKVKITKKRTKRKVKKVVAEPYSIGKNETDPELLGPQTTLESNPLTKKKEKL